MGTTRIKVRVSNVTDPSRYFEEELIVDTGAHFSVVPAPLLRMIGVEPYSRERFRMADGRNVQRDIGVAMHSVGKAKAGAPVIFGLPKDAPLLGSLTLAAMGLEIDPLRHTLRPVRKPIFAVRGRGNLGVVAGPPA